MGTIDDHLAWCARRELRATYIAEIGCTLRRLERAIGPLELATEPLLEDWWANLTICPGSRVTYAAHLSSFYGWLVRQRVRDDDPTERLVRPRLQRRIPRPISDASLRRALAQARAPMSIWLSLAAYMGFRACEIATLRFEDIRSDLGVVMIRDGKGGKQRIVPLHPAVALLLAPAAGTEIGPVFRNAKGGTLIANTVSQRANRYLHDMGIPETLHQLRHWFGTSVYRQSRDIRLTQELMGHASPITTAGYAAWAPEEAANVVGALSVGDETDLDPAA